MINFTLLVMLAHVRWSELSTLSREQQEQRFQEVLTAQRRLKQEYLSQLLKTEQIPLLRATAELALLEAYFGSDGIDDLCRTTGFARKEIELAAYTLVYAHFYHLPAVEEMLKRIIEILPTPPPRKVGRKSLKDPETTPRVEKHLNMYAPLVALQANLDASSIESLSMDLGERVNDLLAEYVILKQLEQQHPSRRVWGIIDEDQ